jgi:transcriptional regulator with XRE-family HTH domain
MIYIAHMKIQESFGALMRKERQRAGLTQTDLAERLKLAQPNIAALESNSRPCAEALAKRIAEKLKLTGQRRKDFIAAATGTTVSGREIAFRTVLERVLRREIRGVDLEVRIGRGKTADMVVTTTDGRRWVIEWKIIGELRDGELCQFPSSLNKKGKQR